MKIIIEDDYSECGCEKCKGKTYSVYRFYIYKNKEKELIKTGLTIEEAREHCSNPETEGDGWFDGYTEE